MGLPSTKRKKSSTSDGEHPPPAPVLAGKPSAATRISAEILDLIFQEVKEMTMNSPLPDMPIQARYKHDEDDLDNQRLTNEEILTYKRFLVKRQLYDMARVCKSWAGCARGVRVGNEVIIIGDKDAGRAIKKLDGWFPLFDPRPIRLTVQCSLTTFHRLILQLAAIGRPVKLEMLTILHAFAPEELPSPLCHEATTTGIPEKIPSIPKMEAFLQMLNPTSVHVEWFAGQPVLHPRTLDRIVSALRHSYQPFYENAPEIELGSNNYQLPPHWQPSDETSILLTKAMTKVWTQGIERLIIRANHIDLQKDLRFAIRHGTLRHFEYHFVSIPDRTVRRFHPRPKAWNSPIPPVGSLRSLDNILMWDFRWHKPRWVRRMDKASAKEAGETYDWRRRMPPAPIEWIVFARYDYWSQQKDRVQFKGEGKRIPWAGRTDEILDSMTDYICSKAKSWPKPYNWGDMTEQEVFEHIIHWLVTRKNTVKKPLQRHVLSLTGSQVVDENLCLSRILEVRMRKERDYLRELAQEETETNDPEPEKRQAEYNLWYCREWLKIMPEEERKKLVTDLRLKHKAKELFTKMNWPLYHPSQPGVRFMVEPRVL